MIAYSRVVDLLEDLDACCIWEAECDHRRMSQWRLRTETILLIGEPSGDLRLFRLTAETTTGCPDPILDAVAHVSVYAPVPAAKY